MNTKLDQTLTQIAEYCCKNKDFEVGGYVTSDFDIVYHDSVHPHSEFYVPSFNFYLDIINKKNDILFCFHSHLASEGVSESDLKFVKTYEISSFIYIINSNSFLSVNKAYEENHFSWNIEGFWEKALLCKC